MANNFITVYEGTDINIGAREVIEPDGIVKRHQTHVIASGQLILPSSPQILSVDIDGEYPETAINITGLGSIVVKSTFSASTAYCNVRFVLFLEDAITLIGVSNLIEIQATDRTENGEYIGNVTTFDNSKIGASYLKLAVSDITNGAVSFYIGGI